MAWFSLAGGVQEDHDSLSLLEQHEPALDATDVERELLAVEHLSYDELAFNNNEQPCDQPDDNPMPGWTLPIAAPPALTTFGLDFLGCSTQVEPYQNFALQEHGGQPCGMLGEMSELHGREYMASDHSSEHAGAPCTLADSNWLSHARFDAPLHHDDSLHVPRALHDDDARRFDTQDEQGEKFEHIGHEIYPRGEVSSLAVLGDGSKGEWLDAHHYDPAGELP